MLIVVQVVRPLVLVGVSHTQLQAGMESVLDHSSTVAGLPAG